MPTIDLPGSPTISFDINELDTTQLKERYKGSIDQFIARAKIWQGRSLDQEVGTYGGVKVKMHVDPNDADGTLKKQQVRAALELLAMQSGLKLDCTVEVYIHGLAQPCLGYVLPVADQLKAVMILGTGVNKTSTQLVATIVRDSLGGEGNPMADAMQVRTSVLHEFGHVFHQLMNPSQFFAFGQMCLLMNKSKGELEGTYSGRVREIFSKPMSPSEMKDAVSRMQKLGAKVSTYAGGHPNEMVAEVFAGLMMGQTYETEVMDAYASMGGPAVSGGSGISRSRGRRKAVIKSSSSSLDESLQLTEVGDGL